MAMTRRSLLVGDSRGKRDMMECASCRHEANLPENTIKPSRIEEVLMKVRAAIRMTEMAFDQVAQVSLQRNGHRQCKFKGDVDHNEKEKPTDATRNYKWPHKIHDNGTHQNQSGEE